MLNECHSRKVLFWWRKCVWLGCWFTSVAPACRRQRWRVGVRDISWLHSKLKNSLCYRRGFLQKIKNKQKKNGFLLNFRFSYFICACFVCICSHVAMYVPGACRDQKRALDPLELELWMVVDHCQWWELDPQLLQEQQVFSITGPPLQHRDSFIYKGLILCNSSASLREFKKPLYHSFKLTQHKRLEYLSSESCWQGKWAYGL